LVTYSAYYTVIPGFHSVLWKLALAMASSSFDFDRALAYALSCVKQEGLSLKAQQVEAVKLLSEGEDVFVWFPTGYGKSICYQLLPFVFDVKLGRTNAPLIDRSVVLLSIIKDWDLLHQRHFCVVFATLLCSTGITSSSPTLCASNDITSGHTHSLCSKTLLL